MCTMRFCSAVKTNHESEWMELENITLSNVTQTQKFKCPKFSLFLDLSSESLVWVYNQSIRRNQESRKGPLVEDASIKGDNRRLSMVFIIIACLIIVFPYNLFVFSLICMTWSPSLFVILVIQTINGPFQFFLTGIFCSSFHFLYSDHV